MEEQWSVTGMVSMYGMFLFIFNFWYMKRNLFMITRFLKKA